MNEKLKTKKIINMAYSEENEEILKEANIKYKVIEILELEE